MKSILIIIAPALLLFACNDNSKTTSVKSNVSDTATSKVDSIRLANQNVEAAMVGTSDSIMPGKTTAASWKIAGFNDPEGFQKFFRQLKMWVANDDTDSIAAHIRFPIRNCASAVEFKKDYGTLFNKEVKKAVADQDPEKFFANYNGAMAGNGDLWFNEIDGNYYVITINNKM